MEIKIFPSFRNKLSKQLNYIASDKPVAAQKFRDNIFDLIEQISSMPYKNRQSIYYNDLNIRDLIFKGYVITYRIRTDINQIEIFGFAKYTERP